MYNLNTDIRKKINHIIVLSVFILQGTEVKAITYSNMQIHEGSDRHDVYVIIDI